MYLRVFRRLSLHYAVKSGYIGLGSNMRSCGPFKIGGFFARKHERTRRDTKHSIYENRAIGIEDGTIFVMQLSKD